jgi:hypothetical protein
LVPAVTEQPSRKSIQLILPRVKDNCRIGEHLSLETLCPVSCKQRERERYRQTETWTVWCQTSMTLAMQALEQRFQNSYRRIYICPERSPISLKTEFYVI